MNNSSARRLAFGMVAVAALGIVWGLWSWTQQVNNTIRLRQMAREVEKAKANDGDCPTAFVGVDYYGHDVLYRVEGGHYMLLSHGRDGVGDVPSFVELASAAAKVDNCFWPNADTLVQDGRVLQGCSK
jgi:hypothetical protein